MIKVYSILKAICGQIIFAACIILFLSYRVAAQCIPTGDPSVYGQNVWNVYGYHGLFTNPGFDSTYSGYFVDTSFNFNSENDFCMGCSPSNAPGYQGCAIATDTMTIIARRQGFPCGLYEIAVNQLPGVGQLAVNGVVVWSGGYVYDGNINAWQGILDPASKVILSVLGGANVNGGTSLEGAINFYPLGNNFITSSGADTFCYGGSVTLSSFTAPLYLWNTAATTQSITVTTAGSFSLTITDTLAGAGCMVVSDTTTVFIIAPQISACPGNIVTYADKGLCGAIVSFDTPTAHDLCSVPNATFGFTAAYQTWTVPAGVTSIDIDAGGAAGGAPVPGMVPGNGARVQTTLAVTPGEVLYINVGGNSGGEPGGYNGGGKGTDFELILYYGNYPVDDWVNSGGGGGFTAIGTTGIPFTDTLVIAAGGGGAGMNGLFNNQELYDYGGNGGGPNGLNGYLNGVVVPNEGATQTAAGYGGSFMQGANGQIDSFNSYYYNQNTSAAGGGGGGYYGGGSYMGAGGGGGSSYVSPVGSSNTQYTTGGNTSYYDGYVNISIPYKTVQTAGLPSGSVFPLGTTTVAFTVTGSSGSASTCSFNVTVSDTEAPVITCPANITANAAAGACGAAVTFTVTASDNCSATVTSTPASGSIFPLGTTTVTSVATDPSGNTSSRQFIVTVNPAPVSVSAAICEGDSYNFNGKLLGQAGLYTDTIQSSTGCDSIINLTLTVNPLPISIITVTGATTFCPGGHVTLAASLGTSYHWSTGATTGTIVVTASGSYTVTVYNSFGCGAGSLPITVNSSSNPIPVITTTKPTTFCQGGNAVLTTSTGASYLWSNGATTKSITARTSGSYIVTVTLTGGCSGTSAPEVVTVNPLPPATISAGGVTTFCLGGNVTLTANSGTGYTYLWNKGETTNSITTSLGGNYKVTITDANGCKGASALSRVTVHPLPNTSITAGSSTELCNGDSVRLTAYPGGVYSWSTGATTRFITVRTPGSYNVTVTNRNECSQTSAPTVVTICAPEDDKTDNGESSANTGSTPFISTNGDFDISVYPNPYTGQFNLKVLSSNTGNINVKLFDITGKLLDERREMPYGTDVILGYGYAAGVYLIEVNQADVTKVTRVVKAE